MATRFFGQNGSADDAVYSASLAATTLAGARIALAELTRASLLTEDVAGRFGCHDLLRAYAAELASATLSAQERDLARWRVLDHYVHTAEWEQFEYDRRVTDWELKRGFERY